MSVLVKNVTRHSPADKAGITQGDSLISLNGNEIMDVLDYRFYQSEQKIILEFLRQDGKIKKKTIKKREYEELGLEFDTYLMDKQRSCKNKCIFCFIDQLPRGMRKSLYFKDDDSRLSFLFGNYITLTNITEHEIQRIIKMHISPINISVHTTNPELRVKMMKNPSAGEALSVMQRFNSAGISMNCQLVLVPGYNDGEELKRTLKDLTELENVNCIALVPVGLTDHRQNLAQLQPFCKETAAAILDIAESAAQECLSRYGQRRVYGADEFYLLSNRDIPSAGFYGDFLQLENGVGLWALLKEEVVSAIEYTQFQPEQRKISIATGTAAYPLICHLVELVKKKWPQINCNVYKVVNNFFGHRITVAGLVTGGDIIKQLSGEDLGSHLLIPSVMLRHENDCFLDDVTIQDLEESLNVRLVTVNNNGEDFVNALLGI